MGRRSRRRRPDARGIAAPTTEYVSPSGDLLVLRAVLSVATRREYAAAGTAAASREDAWQRAAEFLFERLALTSDCFYTLDIQTGLHGPPRLPHEAFNLDTEHARASIRRIAELRPAAAWPGHAEPLTGDVAAQLERAASAG